MKSLPTKEELENLYLIENLTIAEIANKYSYSEEYIRKYFHKIGIPVKRKRYSKKIILSGEVYNYLTVIKESDRPKERFVGVFWVCQCKCGNIKEVQSYNLRKGIIKSCGCYGKEHDGFGEISSSFWTRVKRGAVKRKLELSISIEEAWNLFLKQDRKCALSGKLLVFAKTHKEYEHGGTTASLDRIDNTKGYTIDNVQWLHKDVNLMKNNYTEAEFFEICKAVVITKDL